MHAMPALLSTQIGLASGCGGPVAAAGNPIDEGLVKRQSLSFLLGGTLGRMGTWLSVSKATGRIDLRGSLPH